MEKIQKDAPILIDANIIMFGCTKAHSDQNYSFSVIRETFLQPLFAFLSDAQVHEAVYYELPPERKAFIDSLPNINRVNTPCGLYGTDPAYTHLLNVITSSPEFSYPITHGDWVREKAGKNRADVFLLAYAAHFGIPYLCSNDHGIIRIAQSIPELSSVVPILAAEAVTVAASFHNADKEKKKRLKALYKELSSPEIRGGKLPPNLQEYLQFRERL